MPVTGNQGKNSSKIVTMSDMPAGSSNETRQPAKIVSIEPLSRLEEGPSAHMSTLEVYQSQSAPRQIEAYRVMPAQTEPPLPPSSGISPLFWGQVAAWQMRLTDFFALGVAGVFFVLGTLISGSSPSISPASSHSGSPPGSNRASFSSDAVLDGRKLLPKDARRRVTKTVSAQRSPETSPIKGLVLENKVKQELLPQKLLLLDVLRENLSLRIRPVFRSPVDFLIRSDYCH